MEQICAKGEEPEDPEQRTEQIHPRITSSRLEQLEEFAEDNDMSRSEAVDHLLRVALGQGDVGSELRRMESKLDNVLEAVDAPGIGSELQEETESGQTVVADGATTSKVEYEELDPEHSVPLERDEADFVDPDVVSHTPRSRVPVLRGIITEEQGDKPFSEAEFIEMAKDVYGCAERSALNYLDYGSHRSWYRDPGRELDGSGLQKALQEELERRGSDFAHRVERKDSLQETLGRLRDETGEAVPIWESKPQLCLNERLMEARVRQLLSRLLEAATNEPERVEFQLVYSRVLAYAQEHTDIDSEFYSSQLSELSDAGLELPSKWWI